MLSMSEASGLPGGVGMLGPFDSLYEQPKPRFIFKMPRVVPDQKHKFETDELFRRLSRESEVRYTGYRDRPQEERQIRFQNNCREGHTELAFVATGTNIQLMFNTSSNGYHHHHHHNHHQQHMPNSSSNATIRETDFDKEHGKVHLRSHFIMNGVCVCWRGWVDLERLDGVGCLEFDEERAAVEDALLRDQIERYNQRLREFEERQRSYRGGAMSSHPERTANNSGGVNGSAGGNGQPLEIFNHG
ncbi:protein big brother-like [Planococcus citri]|uniref:protein big brother-like n=1 Tax=Planococcus citri TaxID=170843 RepID=UPI0031F79DB5